MWRSFVFAAVMAVWMLSPEVAAAQPSAPSADGHYQKGLAFNRSKPPDYVNAALWYRRAAEMGHAAAQNDLGVLYRDGLGVSRNYAEAVAWFRKSAAAGNAWGQTDLGWMYNNGWGVARDYAEAMKWYRLAAAQGDALAQNNLGVMYRDSLGVPRDLDQALAWFRKAASGGDARAQQSLRHLESRQRGMAPWEDVLEGKSLRVAISRRGLVYLFAGVPVRLPAGSSIEVEIPIKTFTDGELRELGVLQPDGSISMKEKPHLPSKPMRAVSDAQKRRFFEDLPTSAVAIHWPPYVIVAPGLDKRPAGTKEAICEAVERLYER